MTDQIAGAFYEVPFAHILDDEGNVVGWKNLANGKECKPNREAFERTLTKKQRAAAGVGADAGADAGADEGEGTSTATPGTG